MHSKKWVLVLTIFNGYNHFVMVKVTLYFLVKLQPFDMVKITNLILVIITILNGYILKWLN